jgi:hypothetical protein
MSEKQIIHESGRFWVAKEGHGLFRVYEVTGVASYRRATFHFSNEPLKALRLAITHCDARALQSC